MAGRFPSGNNCLLNLDIFCDALHTFFFWQRDAKDTVSVLGGNLARVYGIIQVKIPGEGLHAVLLTQQALSFFLLLFLVFKGDRKHIVADMHVEVFFFQSGRYQFHFITGICFPDIDRHLLIGC